MNSFLNEYLSGLELERNLSHNTVASYKNDLSTLLSFLESRGIDDPSDIETNHLNSFFKSMTNLGLSSTSSARLTTSQSLSPRWILLSITGRTLTSST